MLQRLGILAVHSLFHNSTGFGMLHFQFSLKSFKVSIVYTMDYYAAIKNDEFVSFVGTWMNLENIILSKLTQEQKMKYCIFSLIGR